MSDELEQPYMLSKEPIEKIGSQIAALEAKRRLNKKLSESDRAEIKRLKRLRNARLYR